MQDKSKSTTCICTIVFYSAKTNALLTFNLFNITSGETFWSEKYKPN